MLRTVRRGLARIPASPVLLSDLLWASAILLSFVLGPRSASVREGAFCLTLATLVALRHRAPALVVTTGSAVWVIQAAVGVHASVWGVGYLLLVHAAGELATGRQSWLPLIAASLSALLVSWKAPVFLVPIVLCWNWGRRSREHRARLSELKDRAARLEREREEIRSKVVVAAEQARIAHELHDVVAHNISVMVIQADAAACVLDSSPQQAKEMVDTIASTGRAAQIELNRPLGILRGS